MKKDLRSMTYEEMSDFICEIGQEKFRAKQVFRWIHARGAEKFNEMTDLPKGLREQLDEISRPGGLEIAEVQISKKDGTRKYLLRLKDGLTIESVYMRYKYGNSICVSSQAGCGMGCKFCASAIGGLKRNLRAGEIEEQILAVQRDVGEKINHIVLMGTGEPFDNYDNVKRFIEIINSKDGLNIGFRRITVSTCGIVPKIREFACDFPQVNLAVSLHASDNAKRNEIMPVNRKYPMEELLETIKEYTKKTRRRITYEYTLVPGVNDSKEQAENLSELLRGTLCHINLIRLNEVKEIEGGLNRGITPEDFCRILENGGVPATLRRELGSDIDAACGQLRAGRDI